MIEPERVRTGVVGAVAVAAIAVCIAAVAVAWWLVAPPLDHRRARTPSPLEHGLFDRAPAPAAPPRSAWIDRANGVARIPIERAIDAVVADPSLIGLEAP